MDTAGILLREARAGANLSIRALAAKAGVAASTVARIEQGTLDPSFTTLSRLLASTGHRLKAQRSPRTPNSPPTRLADLARAWRGSAAAGEPDWTALRATVDLLLQHPERIPAALEDAPRRPASPVQRALLAGLAERLAASAGHSAPAWARRTGALAGEWAPSGTPRMVQAWRASTLPELRARNLAIDELSLFRTGAPAADTLAPA